MFSEDCPTAALLLFLMPAEFFCSCELSWVLLGTVGVSPGSVSDQLLQANPPRYPQEWTFTLRTPVSTSGPLSWAVVVNIVPAGLRP